jgi:tetratricopeptide (TPR) repeat protein
MRALARARESMSTDLQSAAPSEGPQSASPEALAQVIRDLEWQCRECPGSAELHVRLGMAHAMNFDAVRSVESLEAALAADPNHFEARLQYAGMQARLGHPDRAEEEAAAALELATAAEEVAAARRLVEEAQRLKRENRPARVAGKSLWLPLLALLLILAALRLLR